MKIILVVSAFIATGLCSCGYCGTRNPENDAAENRTVGNIQKTVPQEAIETDYFRAYPIDSALFARIDGRSYKKGCRIPLSELRYLKVLHIGFDGETHIGEMICNQAIADDLLDIFRTLFEARYPIERMLLIDEYDADDRRSMEANNSSAFNYREIRNTGKLSNHSFGYAVDINPLFNPCVIVRNGQTIVDPAAGSAYADRTQDFPGKIDRDDLCYREFCKHGFVWGGDWKSLKDYQHFEKPLPERK